MSSTVAHNGSVSIVVALTVIVSVDGLLACSTMGGFCASMSVEPTEAPPIPYCSSTGEGVAGLTMSPTFSVTGGGTSAGFCFKYINLS